MSSGATIRNPAHAGTWYVGTHSGLLKQIEECFNHRYGPGEPKRVVEIGSRKIVALICPHAGYKYSGPVAAHAYHRLAEDGKPDTIVIFGPNHAGRGSALAIMDKGTWRTPLGKIEIDSQIAKQILAYSSVIDIDETAHRFEHSIELQLPFLQYLYGSAFKIVPICFLMQDFDSSQEVGQAVAKALSGKNALIIASTDMTHYAPQETAERKDKIAINSIINMDARKYYSDIELYGISTCGYGPTVAAIVAAKDLSATKANLLCYKTSGDITNDYSAVVGYASISFMKS